MKILIKKINKLKSSPTSKIVNKRIKEFEQVDDHFIELCFCLMTANFRADKCLEIQEEIGEEFHTLTEKKLAKKLKEKGHRFWPQRAERIVLARKHKDYLNEIKKQDSFIAREWLEKNIKGLGLKEASHYLRNTGHKKLAIIDFHIIDLLNNHKIIDFDRKKKSLTPKRYKEIEKTLQKIADKTKMDQAELDLYLWYLETGKILK